MKDGIRLIMAHGWRLTRAVVAMTFAMPVAMAQQMIDFESLPAGTVVFEQFPGVRFPETPRVVAPAVETDQDEEKTPKEKE